MVGCTVPTPTPTPTPTTPPAPTPTPTAKPVVKGPLVQTDLVGDDGATGVALGGLVLLGGLAAAVRRRVR